MIDADRARNGDRERGEQDQSSRARRIGRRGEGERREHDRRNMRPALPVAHLARVKAAEILRAERAAEQSAAAAAARSAAPRRTRQTAANACAGTATASLMRGLARLLRAIGAMRLPPARRQPLQRVDRIIELEVLDALLLQLLGRRREARIGRVVALEQLVLDLGLVEQVAAQIGLADDRPVLVIGIATAAARRCRARSRLPAPSGPTACSSAPSSAAARLRGRSGRRSGPSPCRSSSRP